MSNEFPTDVVRFIELNIDSVAELEGLLFIRTEIHHQWDITSLTKLLYINSHMAQQLISTFQQRGFVDVTSANEQKFNYRPNNPGTENLIDRLATLYRERPVAVISLIYSKPNNKAKAFADAFRLRKEN
jgi:hypothetical protein